MSERNEITSKEATKDTSKDRAAPPSSSKELHAQIQSWATRVGGCVGSTLANGISSHRFSSMLTTKDIDAFCQLAAIATTSSHHGCIASDGKKYMVLSANVNAAHGVNSNSKKRSREGGADGMSTGELGGEFERPESKRQRFDASAAGAGMRALHDCAQSAEFDAHVLGLARGALSGLGELRGPKGEVAVEGTALHARAGDGRQKAATTAMSSSSLSPPPTILLVRLSAGIPLSISQLRSAVGGEVWADGTFRVVPLEEQKGLEQSLPPVEARAKLAAAQSLLPLVAGFTVPGATSTFTEGPAPNHASAPSATSPIAQPTPTASPRASPSGTHSRTVRHYLSSVI